MTRGALAAPIPGVAALVAIAEALAGRRASGAGLREPRRLAETSAPCLAPEPAVAPLLPLPGRASEAILLAGVEPPRREGAEAIPVGDL